MLRPPNGGAGGSNARWIDELSNGLLLNRYSEVYTSYGAGKRRFDAAWVRGRWRWNGHYRQNGARAGAAGGGPGKQRLLRYGGTET